MRERAPAFRSADHNADSACKPRQRAPADQAGEVAAPDHSWAIDVSTADGHSWRNGVRLDTKAEAEAYILTHAAFEMDGYVTGRAIPCGDAPNCRVVSNRKGGRPVLTFPDGSCVLLDGRRVRVRLIQIGLGIRDLRDRASVCAGRDERFSERNALPGLWRQRTTALDLDHGSLTLFSILLNALPFIHSIPIKSPAPARWLDVPSQSPGLGVTYTWDHCLPQSEPRTATLRN